MSENNQEPDKFDLDYQFFLYLKAFRIHPSEIPIGQYGSWKRCFYAGLGQMMSLFAMQLSRLPMDQQNERILYMTEQITKFWQSDADRSKGEIVNN